MTGSGAGARWAARSSGWTTRSARRRTASGSTPAACACWAPQTACARLETLEHAAITVRMFARALADSIRLAEDNNPLEDPEVRDRLAGALTELAVAIRIYGGLAAASGPSTQEQLRAELERYPAAAQDQQDRLSELLGTDPAARPVGWPLRGELISQLGRLRGELRAAGETTSPPPRRFRSWRRPLQAGRRQRRSPTRQRPPA
jgi:hypothetical protein